MSKFQVGQIVLYSLSWRKDGTKTATPIIRVGRKWVYIKVGHREYGFDPETGAPAKPDTGISRIWTTEEWSVEERRSDLVKRLHEHGLYFKHGRPTIFLLDALVNVLDREGEPAVCCEWCGHNPIRCGAKYDESVAMLAKEQGLI